MRVAVFDLDGTLADTSADLLAAANACFEALGHGHPLGPQDRLTAFAGGRAMLRLGFERLGLGGDVDGQYPQLLAHYAQGLDRQTRLYPGAVAAIEALRAKGWQAAICTNKPAALAEELLRRLGVRDLFASLVGADTLPVRKPDPAPYRLAVAEAGGGASFLVGDTVTDRDTARAAGVPIVLVAFGPEGEGVARLAPDALLASYDDLPALAETLVL
jgi:phosphoglycolate phosphatase